MLLGAVPARLAAQASVTIDRTVFVDAVGSDSKKCANLRQVLADIPASRSTSNPYLVKLGPGSFNCGTASVNVPDHVTLEGAGHGATRVFGTRNSAVIGVVDIDSANGAGLRDLAVSNLSI